MKNFIHKFFIPVLFFALVLASCDKYLGVEPKGQQLLTKVEDYNQWLNSHEVEETVPLELNQLADNVDKLIISVLLAMPDERLYTWQEQFSDNPKDSPMIWNKIYKTIYYFNTVLQGIDEATGSEEQKKMLKAEALLGRALEYFYLVNLYGKVYDANTAEQDLAVPFVTSNDLEDDVPDRSTVQEIYDQIIMDIEAAIVDLPEDNSENRSRGSVAAAYSVLARVYLYMGDYTKAAENAQLALDNGPNTILDYSTMFNVAQIPTLLVREDAIYARFSTSYYRDEIPTLAFLQSFDITDLRLNFFYSKENYYSDLGDYTFTTRDEISYYGRGVPYATAMPNWGTSVAEMRLIIAEAAARVNELETAINQLDLLRKKRFRAMDYVKHDPANPVQEEVLQKILDERTFEFAYCGLRWFDMRRLDAEGRMPAVNRYDEEGTLVATLPPGSARYTLQIPIQVMLYHTNWTQNPTDED